MSQIPRKERTNVLCCISCRSTQLKLEGYYVSRCRHFFCKACLDNSQKWKIRCPLGCGELAIPYDFTSSQQAKRGPGAMVGPGSQSRNAVPGEKESEEMIFAEHDYCCNKEKKTSKKQQGDSMLLPDEREIPVRFFESMLKLVRFVDKMRQAHNQLFEELNLKLGDLECQVSRRCFPNISTQIRRRQFSSKGQEALNETAVEIKKIEKDIEALKWNFNNFLQSSPTEQTGNFEGSTAVSEKNLGKNSFTLASRTGEFSKLDTSSGPHNLSNAGLQSQFNSNAFSDAHANNNSLTFNLRSPKPILEDELEDKSQKNTLNSSMEVTSKTKREEFLGPIRSNRSLDLGNNTNERKFMESDISFQDLALQDSKRKSKEIRRKAEKSISSVEMSDISELKSTIRFEQPKRMVKKAGSIMQKNNLQAQDELLKSLLGPNIFAEEKENKPENFISQQLKSPEFARQKISSNQRCLTVQNMLLETIDEKFFETFHSLNNGQNVAPKNRQSTEQEESSYIHMEVENIELLKSFVSPGDNTPRREKKTIRGLMDNLDQKGIHFKNDIGFENEPRYLINASWWRRWVDFVDFSEEESKSSKLNTSELKYNDRPGKINNRELLKNLGFESNFFDSSTLDLREGLLEHYDFEALSENVFRQLKSWYGVDFEVVRFLKRDPVQRSRVYLELYPDFSLENLVVLSILVAMFLIAMALLMVFLKRFINFLLSFVVKPKIPHITLRDMDLNENYFDSASTPQTSSADRLKDQRNGQTINISLNTIRTFASLGAGKGSSFESADQKRERLMNYGNNFCRCSSNLKWKDLYLKKIGWRLGKESFFITYKDKEKKMYQGIFSLNTVAHCKLKIDESIIKNSIKNLLENHQIPNVQRLLRFDIDLDLKSFIVVKRIENCSVKDLVFNVKDPKMAYNKKYEKSGKPLSPGMISAIGRAVLIGLKHMHKLKLYHSHLHSGNVYLRDGKVLLGEVENFIFNLPPKNEQVINLVLANEKNLNTDKFESIFEVIDIIQFGYLLYEMATGCELKMSKPDPNDYIFIPKSIGGVLKQIFPEEDKSVITRSLFQEDSKFNTDLLSLDKNSANSKMERGKKRVEFPLINTEELLSDDLFIEEKMNLEDEEAQNISDGSLNFNQLDQITKSVLNTLHKKNHRK